MRCETGCMSIVGRTACEERLESSWIEDLVKGQHMVFLERARARDPLNDSNQHVVRLASLWSKFSARAKSCSAKPIPQEISLSAFGGSLVILVRKIASSEGTSEDGISYHIETDQILSPTFTLLTVARTTQAGITFFSLARPAFTKNGSETPIVGKRGSRVSFNRSGRNATTAVLWDRVPAFLGMSIGSAYISGRYVSLVVLSSDRLMLAHMLCSYIRDEAIRSGMELVAWPTWCSSCTQHQSPSFWSGE
ncbi:hypothetical protein WN943_027685 [Citrus x changshan-huyou]